MNGFRKYEYSQFILRNDKGEIIASFEGSINPADLEKYLYENNNRFKIEEFKTYLKNKIK